LDRVRYFATNHWFERNKQRRISDPTHRTSYEQTTHRSDICRRDHSSKHHTMVNTNNTTQPAMAPSSGTTANYDHEYTEATLYHHYYEYHNHSDSNPPTITVRICAYGRRHKTSPTPTTDVYMSDRRTMNGFHEERNMLQMSTTWTHCTKLSRTTRTAAGPIDADRNTNKETSG
jgi:hypothetical protein